MSWSIEVVKNEVAVSKKCAKEMFKAQSYPEEIWYEETDVAQDGRLYFNGDHMEHMDYLGNNEAMIAVLGKHKVKGDICFGSLEGDNAGSFWGYRFDGQGGMIPLRGAVVFEEVRLPLKDKTLVLTGRLESMTRSEATARISDAGGKVSDSVTAKTDYVIIGEDPGSKAAKAKKLGRPTLDEKAFLAILDGK